MAVDPALGWLLPARACGFNATLGLQEAVMPVLDFSWTKTRAFAHGFMKGLAAPAMLFGGARALVFPACPALAPLQPMSRPDADALAADWQRVGDHLRAVVETNVPKEK